MITEADTIKDVKNMIPKIGDEFQRHVRLLKEKRISLNTSD